MVKTFYDVLEVSRTAGSETIRAAYDALSRAYSAKADAGDSDAANRLKLIRTAYEVLSDTQKKALYDRRLESLTPQGTSAIATPSPKVAPETTTRPNTAPVMMAETRQGSGFGRWAVAVIMGFFSGIMIRFLSALVFMGSPDIATGFVILFGGWALSSYVMQKGAISISKVVSRGFLIGAAEWLLMIPAGMIMAGRLISSSGATAGAALGGGIVTFLTGGVAIAMAVVCLIGFAVSYFIGREMKPEVMAATRKCPECAEMIQAEARKCRYCGFVFAGDAASPKHAGI